MQCEVDNLDFDAARIIYRDRGYGSPGANSKYSLEVSDGELLEKFSGNFEEFVRQCKLDDDGFAESDIPEIKEIGYVSLNNMLALHRAVLGNLMKDFLYFQLLESLLGRNERRDWRFAINEIAEVVDRGHSYIFSGSGYFI